MFNFQAPTQPPDVPPYRVIVANNMVSMLLCHRRVDDMSPSEVRLYNSSCEIVTNYLNGEHSYAKKTDDKD